MPERNVPSSKPKCPTFFLDDNPTNEDTLALSKAESPHERIAETIETTILSKSDSRTKVIALEGSWGSGKSTVVSMLQKRLSTNKNIAVLNFDAWEHQGDPLRRIFLESFVNNLSENYKGWISDERAWRERLLRFTKRSKQSHTSSSRGTTRFARWLALTALLVPIGTPFLTEGLQEGITLSATHQIAWLFWIGIILTAPPFLVIIVNFIFSLPCSCISADV